MKMWIIAKGISPQEWRDWLSEIQLWFQNVQLHNIRKFHNLDSYAAIFEFSYYIGSGIKANSIQPERSDRIQCILGSLEVNGQILKEYTSLTKEDFGISVGEFAYMSIECDKIVLATDFYATQPIFYSNPAKKFYAASDLRLLLLNPTESWAIDRAACSFFLSSSSSIGENELPQQNTFFQGIRKIAPHHIIEFVDGNIKNTSYLDLKILFTKSLYHDTNYVGAFRNSFDKSVYNKSKQEPVALMLSGGIDSGIVLASLASSQALQNVTAFNLSFRDQELCNSQDKAIAERLIKDFDVNGGIIWGDELLRIPNALPGSDPFDYIDGPIPSANKLAQETVAYYALNAGCRKILTGEQGDAVLGEDNIILIYDSLFKSNLYKDVYDLIQSALTHKNLAFFMRKVLSYVLLNLHHGVRDLFYEKNYWGHTSKDVPSFFSKEMQEIEKNSKQKSASLNMGFELVGHMYTFDYFFPRASYFDSINTFIPHSHPFIDKEVLQFIFSSPTHIHCDYKNYKPGEKYLRAKYLAREAYRGILPDYARLKAHKTSYAGMARKIMSNSKNDLIKLFFDRDNLHIEALGLIDKYKFRKYLGANLIHIEDPNNNLGLNYQYLRTAIQLEIWLCCVKSSVTEFRELIRLKPPRALADIEWIKK